MRIAGDRFEICPLSPKVCMAMTAPGIGSFCGTASWRKTFKDSHAVRLRSARSFLSKRK
jgi:hypothetical protein